MAFLGVALLGLLAGAAVMYVLYRPRFEELRRQAEAEAQRLRESAQAQSRELLVQAQAEALRVRNEAEADIKQARQALLKQEERIQQLEERLARSQEKVDRKLDDLERRERGISQRERQIERLHREAEELKHSQQAELERIAGLTTDEAREIVLKRVEATARDDAARLMRQIEQEAKDEAEKRAKKIISIAIQRLASEYVAELTVTTVPLPSEELKGRIIGREGRNIRAFEQITGVDIIVDDTPEAVTLSCHDPVRREVARLALTKLLKDGRIHPARIEEVVEKTRQEIETIMREEGERVVYEAGVQGLHPDLIRILGRLKYRTSYGQNVLQHSLECALLAGAMASELGANVQVAKTAALLHDIGKAVDHEVQGPHALIGADIARRLGRSPAIVHAIAAHHFEEEPQTVEAFIVAAADAMSGGRPGARRETLDLYIKRLEALETVATSFPGVQRAFAIQAGREVRVMVQPDAVDDLGSITLARNISRKIEESLQYPGQIRVTVIRETRAVDYAR
ncbi:ribonuclease Y [Kallotenue papyrolyticum]|uniref:ribonuclease Y n=1 Tax=Kallotenue papyrolyticum TaxID=1325125 RepID=UPI0004785F59